MIVLLIFLIVFLLLLLMLRGRTGNPALKALQGHSYAHRGLYGGEIPENSLKAFDAAFQAGYGIEFDLHLLKDGNLAVLHDSNLQRMTGTDRILEDLTTEELSRYRLGDSQETIPTFSQVLSLCSGRCPLIIELKSHQGNSSLLTETACRMLEGYPGSFCLESFDPRCVLWLRKHRPELVRGQLSENFLKAKNSRIPWILRLLASWHLESFLTRPDFIAHRYCDRKTPFHFLIRRFWRVQGVTWTVKNPREFDQAVKEGWIPIFEGFRPPSRI